MGLRVHRSGVFFALVVFLFALTSGFAGVALADTPLPDPSQDPALATTLDQSVSGNVATPTVVRELTDQRTPTSTAYLLSDGQVLVRTYLDPIRYKDANGDWQDINTTLVPTGTIGQYESASTPVDVTLGTGPAGSSPVSVERGSCDISFRLLNATLDSNFVVGDDAYYSDVTHDTDLHYTVTASGLKEIIALNSADAPSSFTYYVTHAGYELRQDDDGQWGFYGPGADKPKLVLSSILVFDSSLDVSNDHAYCPDAQMTVKPGVGGSYITYSVPKSWLTDPARVFPVQVDPTLNAPGLADTFIAKTSPTTSYGSSSLLWVGPWSTTTAYNRALLKFDFSGITPDPTLPSQTPYVSGATLVLNQYWSGSSGAQPMYVGHVTAPNWTEATCWQNLVTGGRLTYDYYKTQTVTGTNQINMACQLLTQRWVQQAQNYPNYGFILYQKEDGTQDSSNYTRKIYSKEAATANRPHLDTVYEYPKTNATTDLSTYTVGNTVTATVTATTGDPTMVRNLQLAPNQIVGAPQGQVGWFKVTPPAGWTYQAVKLNGVNDGYIGFNTDSSVNPAAITLDIAHSTPYNSATKTAVFKFTINDSWGALQSCSFDSSGGMGDTSDGYVDIPWMASAAKVYVQPNAPRHTTADLGSLAGEQATAVLDQAKLGMTTIDLAIASWGPQAALSRTYSSTNTAATYFAAGWRFSFQQGLTSIDGSAPNANNALLDYTAENGDVYAFKKSGTNWLAPNGLGASLVQNGSAWALTFYGGDTVNFDSTGKLTSEVDRNVNTVTYARNAGNLTITAANGEQILVTCANNQITKATYTATVGGQQVTREVDYVEGSAPQVTYYPTTAAAHTVKYAYASNRLTTVTAADWPAVGKSASETFNYTSGGLSSVYFADYLATDTYRQDAWLSISNGTQTATVTRHGCVGGAVKTAVTTTYTRNPDGTMATRIDPGSAQWSYAYDAANRRTKQTSPLGGVCNWIYDSRGDLTSSSDELGHTTSYSHPTNDADPNRDLPLSSVDPLGSTTYNTYDAHGNCTVKEQVLNTNGERAHTESSYDSRGRKTQEKALISGTPTSGVWKTTDYSNFAACGQPQTTIERGVKLSAAANPQDLTTTASYDGFGNLLTTTDTTGTRITETDTYDIAGNQLTSADAVGTVTHNTFDNLGNQIETYQTASGAPTGEKANWSKTTYDAVGCQTQAQPQLWTAAHPEGQTQSTQTTVYDGLGNKIYASDSTIDVPYANPDTRAAWQYDGRGNVTVSWADGVIDNTDPYRGTQMIYDEVNRRLTSIDPAGSGTHPSYTSYREDGSVFVQTNPDQSHDTYTYDFGGNVLTEVRSDGQTTTKTYDLAGRLLTETDPGTAATTTVYDLLSRPTGLQLVGQQQTTTTYNTLGWALSTTDAVGTVTTNVYDAAGRQVSTQTGNQAATTSAYDDCSRLLTQTETDSGGTVRVLINTYDAFGNTTEEKHTVNSVTVKDISIVSDSLGRPASTTDQNSGLVHDSTYPLNPSAACRSRSTTTPAPDKTRCRRSPATTAARRPAASPPTRVRRRHGRSSPVTKPIASCKSASPAGRPAPTISAASTTPVICSISTASAI
jgi:YD repeat-containing protein